MHIRLKQIWTSVYYDVHWEFRLGQADPNEGKDEPEKGSPADETRESALFLRQKFLRQGDWGIMKHDVEPSVQGARRAELQSFSTWLWENYPRIEVD